MERERNDFAAVFTFGDLELLVPSVQGNEILKTDVLLRRKRHGDAGDIDDKTQNDAGETVHSEFLQKGFGQSNKGSYDNQAGRRKN